MLGRGWGKKKKGKRHPRVGDFPIELPSGDLKVFNSSRPVEIREEHELFPMHHVYHPYPPIYNNRWVVIVVLVVRHIRRY